MRGGLNGAMQLPQFSLAMLLYLITAAAIYVRVEIATSGTRNNDNIGGLVIWLLIGGGVALWWFRRRT